MKNITNEVFNAIAEVGGLNKKQKEDIKLSDSLSKFKFDVLDEVEVIAIVEQELHKTVSISEAEKMVTVGDMVNLFKAKRKKRGEQEEIEI